MFLAFDQRNDITIIGSSRGYYLLPETFSQSQRYRPSGKKLEQRIALLLRSGVFNREPSNSSKFLHEKKDLSCNYFGGFFHVAFLMVFPFRGRN